MNMQVGIIGTGWVAGVHLEALKQIPGVHVAAVAGKNESRAAELAKSAGGRCYGDYRTMLAKEKLDAVFILMPPHVHGEMEKACAGHVPAVLVEKPVANNLQAALEVQQIFKEAGTMVSTGYMMRYHASVNRVRELFAEAADQPALITGRWVNPMPGPLWWRKDGESGGQFVEQCTHMVDAARYIAGEVSSVSAFSARGFVKDVPQYDTDDAMVVNVAFASGAVGAFYTGCFPRKGPGDVGLQVKSRSLSADLAGWGMSLAVVHADGTEETLPQTGNEIFIAQNRAFLEAAASGDASGILSTYDSAVETLRVTLAAKESARTGQIVRL
ncbi:MAG: oxidoreductase domain protein [Paenibacillaceae bacterium]|jgi:predicted dehydrogenase|nr:oxidoreductase domain protein [Paenibacillaceae bacterium]